MRTQVVAVEEAPAEVGRKRETVEVVATPRDRLAAETHREKLILQVRQMKEDVRFRQHDVRKRRQICQQKRNVVLAIESGLGATPLTSSRQRPSSIADVSVCRAEVDKEILRWMGISSDQSVDLNLKQWRQRLTAAVGNVDDDDFS
jgi:hypothetical protein